MPEYVFVVIFLILGTPLVFLAFQHWGSRIVRYMVAEGQFSILVGPYRIINWPLEEITSVQRTRIAKTVTSFRIARYYNRVIGDALIIERVGGQRVAISPSHVLEFEEELRGRR